MYTKEAWEETIKEIEEEFKEPFTALEKEFIHELYKDLDSIDKESFNDCIEEVEKQFYDILYPRCWNFKTLTVAEKLYEV